LGVKKLPADSDLAVTKAAIYRPALFGLEGYGSGLAAIGTSSGVSLAQVVDTGGTFRSVCLSCLTAFGAALGFVGITFLLELLLFSYGERKRFAAIRTVKGLVLKTHGWPPLVTI
jgi:hypothetical protein